MHIKEGKLSTSSLPPSSSLGPAAWLQKHPSSCEDAIDIVNWDFFQPLLPSHLHLSHPRKAFRTRQNTKHSLKIKHERVIVSHKGSGMRFQAKTTTGSLRVERPSLVVDCGRWAYDRLTTYNLIAMASSFLEDRPFRNQVFLPGCALSASAPNKLKPY